MKKCLLITGGEGYLGGRIVEKFSNSEKYTVYSGTRSPGRLTSLIGKSVNVLHMDFNNQKNLEEACTGVDTIIHCAAPHEISSMENPEAAINDTIGGTFRLLRAAQKVKVRRIIYFSTAHIYSSPLAGIIDEEKLPRPIHLYAIIHKAAEDFVIAENDIGSIEGIVLRLSNAFGRPASIRAERWTLVINDLCRQAIVNKRLVLKSTGLQLRDFITITDVVRAVEHFICLDHELLGNGIFNIGGSAPRQIIYMANLIADRCLHVAGYKPEVHTAAASDERTSEPQLDYRIGKLLNTGYKLLNNIEEEIDKTLLFCKNNFL